MRVIYKIIALLLILASMTTIGCTDVAAEAPVNEVSSADTDTTSKVELSDEIVQVQHQDQPIAETRIHTIYND
ncbi:hypothetical protein HNV12_19455 [Methanococcoides sp. SA1]|nr:hypothetical protein [Methanococcoides sp. SA1]